MHEPRFRRSRRAAPRLVLPGNKEYVEGDTIPRPPSGGGGGGSEAAADGDGEDAFRFALSQDEFVDLFLEDLELPDLAKRKLTDAGELSWHRAGYTSAARRRTSRHPHHAQQPVAPHRAEAPASRRTIAALEAEIALLERRGRTIRDRADRARAGDSSRVPSAERIPYIDPVDLRYRRFESRAAADRPGGDVLPDGRLRLDDRAHEGPGQAVLHAALPVPERRYQHVEIVFIRHTHRAEEVDEETFFHSPETGGTVVSTALGR